MTRLTVVEEGTHYRITKIAPYGLPAWEARCIECGHREDSGAPLLLYAAMTEHYLNHHTHLLEGT